MTGVFLIDMTNATTLLLERGAEVNAATSSEERAIIFIQTQDDIPVLQMLLSAGAEINFQDIQGLVRWVREYSGRRAVVDA